MRRFWTEAEVDALRVAYTQAATSEDLDLNGLAARLGRTRFSVSIKAGRMGLTDIARRGVNVRADAPKYETQEERNAAVGAATKARIARDGHPCGMRGKSHTAETKARLSETSSAWAKAETPTQRAARIERGLRTKDANGGVNAGRSRGSWKAGWREIGGKRNFYRSRWEANYARWLEWLKQRGEIKDWQHEPETFWFEAIKRGVRSYKPDFRVWENDGTSLLHEVKGYMDARSKTTLKRMAKYHPAEKIMVIREAGYNEIARKVGPFIADWERCDRSGRQ